MKMSLFKDIVLGIDIGGTTCKCGVFTTDGTLVYKDEIPTRKDEGGSLILSDIKEHIPELVKAAGRSCDEIKGVGIGEHARIFYFLNNGQEEIYMGSADWMPRNLDKRVEILFPVEDASIMKEIRHILDIQLADNVKAQILQPDGTYVKIDKRGKNLVCAQEYFCEEAMERAKEQMPAEVHSERVFVPAEPMD